jgi:hypothetical protein
MYHNIYTVDHYYPPITTQFRARWHFKKRLVLIFDACLFGGGWVGIFKSRLDFSSSPSLDF